LGAKSAQDPEIFRSKSSKPHAGQQDQKSDGHYFKLRALTMESPRITNKVHILERGSPDSVLIGASLCWRCALRDWTQKAWGRSIRSLKPHIGEGVPSLGALKANGLAVEKAPVVHAGYAACGLFGSIGLMTSHS
jgi:hypothetical protein